MPLPFNADGRPCDESGGKACKNFTEHENISHETPLSLKEWGVMCPVAGCIARVFVFGARMVHSEEVGGSWLPLQIRRSLQLVGFAPLENSRAKAAAEGEE